MTFDEFLKKLKSNQERLYSTDLNGLSIPNSDFMKILFNKKLSKNRIKIT